MKCAINLSLLALIVAASPHKAGAQWVASACGSSTCAAEFQSKLSYQAAAGAPGSSYNCTIGKDFYTNTSNGDLYKCVTTGTPGTWALVPSGATTNAATFNNSGSGAASGTTFDGSAAYTISYNTLGAAPASTVSANVVYCSGSASATAATCAGVPSGATTYTGMSGFFVAGATSTGAPLTLNIATIGAKNVYLNGAATSSTNFVTSGQVYPFQYDGTEIQLAQPTVFPGGVTAASVSTGTSPPSVPSGGTGGAMTFGEGTAPSSNCSVSAVDCIYALASAHLMFGLFNAGTPLPFVQGPTSITSNYLPQWSAEGVLGSGVVAPSGTIVGTTDTQTLTNKTVDGVTPTVFGYVDPTSSIQTQLNAKQATLTGTGIARNTGASTELSGDCTTSGSNAVTCKPGTTVPGSSVTLAGSSQIFICTTTCTVTVPVPSLNVQYCVFNGDNVSTAITFSAIGSSARYENTARTAFGTAGTGTFVSGGAVGDGVCILGQDSTHYLTVSYSGSWTAN